MSSDVGESYEAIDLAEAVRVLASESGLDAGGDDAAEIACGSSASA